MLFIDPGGTSFPRIKKEHLTPQGVYMSPASLEVCGEKSWGIRASPDLLHPR